MLKPYFLKYTLTNEQVIMGASANRCSLHYLLYGVQIFVICVAISASIFKLFSTEMDSQFWVSILSSSIGYILPNPTIKCKCVPSKKPLSVSNEEVNVPMTQRN